MYSIVTVIPQSTEPNFDLVTAAAASAALGVANDATLAAQITAASQQIATMCDRVFALETVQELVRLNWSDYVTAINLSRYPVVGEATVLVNGVEIDAALIDLDPDKGMLHFVHHHHHGFAHWHREADIVVEYTGGYDLPGGAPASLARACLELIHDQTASLTQSPGVRDIWSNDARLSFFDPRVGRGPISPIVDSLITPFKRIA